MFAEYQYYLHEKLKLAGMLFDAVDVMMKTDPVKPSIKAQEKLLNSLLEIIKANCRVQLITDKEEFEVWKFIKE